MNNWLSEHYELQLSRRRDFSPKRSSHAHDRRGSRPHPARPLHVSREYRFRQRYDEHPPESRLRTLNDVDYRNRRTSDVSSRLLRLRVPDIKASKITATFVGKSLERGNAHTELRTNTEQRYVDSDELFYDNYRCSAAHCTYNHQLRSVRQTGYYYYYY